jgi:hypothetical protein
MTSSFSGYFLFYLALSSTVDDSNWPPLLSPLIAASVIRPLAGGEVAAATSLQYRECDGFFFSYARIIGRIIFFMIVKYHSRENFFDAN